MEIAPIKSNLNVEDDEEEEEEDDEEAVKEELIPTAQKNLVIRIIFQHSNIFILSV